MHHTPFLIVFLAALSACQTYERANVDLAAHARAFERRHEPQSQHGPFDLTDGITREEGRGLALLFDAECRLARLRAGVAQASTAHAGTWDDPVLSADVSRILETVPHQWLVGGALELTLPLFGRKDHEHRLATISERAAYHEARIVEQETMLALDRAFAQWSAQQRRVEAAADMLERIEGLEAIAQRLLAAGELSRPEARVFALERLSRQDELSTGRAAVAMAELTLRRLVGLHPKAPVTFVAAADLPVTARPELSIDAFLNDSPRGLRFALDYDISEERLALEIARQWPDVMLGPGWQEEDAQPRLALGVALPLPLWNRNARAIAEADAGRDLAIEAFRGGLERFFHDVVAAERSYDVALERRQRIERELVPLALQQLEDSRTQAERGMLDPLLLLDSLARVHRARLDAIDAELEQALRAADLRALGWITNDHDQGSSR